MKPGSWFLWEITVTVASKPTEAPQKGPVCLCDDKSKRNYYRYYDTPDGCDVDKKLVVTTRYGIVAGLIAGSYDILMYSHAVGFGGILQRYARHVIPLALIGATFTAVSSGLLHLREQDDRLNYLAGGMACGPLVALYTGSPHGVVAGGVALGIAGFLKKGAVDGGHCFFPKVHSHRGLVNSWRNDWTVVEDPRNAMKHTCAGKQGQLYTPYH